MNPTQRRRGPSEPASNGRRHGGAPWWPTGHMAQMVVVPGTNTPDGQNGMGLRKITITGATSHGTGWQIEAQDGHGCKLTFDVDVEGVGDYCEPWSEELERKYGPLDPEHWVVLLTPERHGDPTHAEGTCAALLHAVQEPATPEGDKP